MPRPSLNLRALVSPETDPELALAVVMLWGEKHSETDREHLALRSAFKRFFCATQHEGRAAEAPMSLEFIRLLIDNSAFQYLELTGIQFRWWTRDADIIHDSRYEITDREDLKRGGPGDRVMIRGRCYVIIDCHACETTQFPFGDVTVIPARFVKIPTPT